MISTSHLVLDDSVDSHAGIERYLIDEFERISLEQGLSVYSWPSQGAIDRLVHNSAGQFIAEDKYSNPMQQLDIVLGLPIIKTWRHVSPDPIYVTFLHSSSDWSCDLEHTRRQ
jgi:hypothetical protein